MTDRERARSSALLSYQVLRAYEQTALHALQARTIFPLLSPRRPYVKPTLFSRRWWRVKTLRFREARIWQWRLHNLDDGWSRHERW